MFAQHCEKLTVICLQEGLYDLPSNVTVLSLGKEEKESRLQYIQRFFTYIVQQRKEYNRVFVHMNQVYVLLGSAIWFLLRKKVHLWYMHKSVNLSLRLSVLLVKKIFTASAQSFRVKTAKTHYVGHGIDVDFFKPDGTPQSEVEMIRFITVGRMSPVKDYETLLDTISRLRNDGVACTLHIIGGPSNADDEQYIKDLRTIVTRSAIEDVVSFEGPCEHAALVQKLQSADIFLHASKTGSLDKAALEAMACGLLVVSSNDAMVNDVLKEYKELTFSQSDVQDMVEKIKRIMRLDPIEKQKLRDEMRQIVVDQHSLSSLIPKLVREMQ